MKPDKDRIAEAFDTAFDTLVAPLVESPEWDAMATRVKNKSGAAAVPRHGRWFGPALGFAVMMVVLLIGGAMWLLKPAGDETTGGVASAYPPTTTHGPLRWVSPSIEGVEMTLTPAAVPAVPGDYEIEVTGSGNPMAFYACPRLHAEAVPDKAHDNVLPNCELLPTTDVHLSDDPALPRTVLFAVTDETIDDGGVTIASMGGFGTITGTVVLDIDTEEAADLADDPVSAISTDRTVADNKTLQWGLEMAVTPATIPATPGIHTIKVNVEGLYSGVYAIYVCPNMHGTAEPDEDHSGVYPYCTELEPFALQMYTINITQEMIDDGGITVAGMGGFGVTAGTVVLKIGS